MLQVSPYDFPSLEVDKDEIRETLERYIDFEAVPGLWGRNTPELLVSTVHINAGVFETLES